MLEHQQFAAFWCNATGFRTILNSDQDSGQKAHTAKGRVFGIFVYRFAS
jgi:hypothetical protein